MSETARAAEAAARDSYGRLVAYLAAQWRDVARAEDALGDALVAALETWPRTGVPDRPEAWLLTAARRRLVDGARHSSVAAAAEADLFMVLHERPDGSRGSFPDERLALLFVCTHPAVDASARTPLMLQTVLGLDAGRIASAFLVTPATMSQRLVRVKTKTARRGSRSRFPRRTSCRRGSRRSWGRSMPHTAPAGTMWPAPIHSAGAWRRRRSGSAVSWSTSCPTIPRRADSSP